MIIDYYKIARAVEFYKSRGFQYVEVPWFVDRDTLDITKPKEARYFDTYLGSLVGSGEQSFLQIRNELSFRHMCVTPCFRDEPKVDEVHRNYFMKVELIDVNPTDIDKAYWDMFNLSREFFELYEFTDVVKTTEGKDIYINGMEVGSYGIRSFGDFHWVYGTGCAEPRLSQAIMKGQ